LAQLPDLRRFLRDTIAASPTRAIVARLQSRSIIPIHTDTPRFFRGTIRLSVPVVADDIQSLYCNGLVYRMAPGEVWAIDNLRPHGVHNPGDGPRVNVLADYAPSTALIELVAAGERGLGCQDEAEQRTIESLSRQRYRTHRWRSVRYELFKLLWRRG
jgi:kumamolisin